MLAGEVSAKRFTPTRWRDGYDMAEVDRMLARVEATLAAYERRRPADSITADDVIASRFVPTKFRAGYDQTEVDDYLDEVVVALRQHESRWGK